MLASLMSPLAIASMALAHIATVSQPSLSDIQAAQHTTFPRQTTSDVKGGVAFDRFYQVWLENIDYEDSEKDEDMKWFASQGILLTEFYAVTHPSEPNYCAAVSGDTFGMDNDNFNQIPNNVSTIADLLHTKKISWAEYQEHIPYAGFQGYNYPNQKTGAPDYVRKHNPLVLFDSVVEDEGLAAQIKSFDDFSHDLKAKELPQWAFITPNMTNDAHDTNISFGGNWERHWMSGLLKNDYFTKDTLILLTFDEENTYNKTNRIYSVLVGGAVPEHLKGTKDDTFYTHYSSIATVSANWGLPSLGRWDCGANIFQIVANKTGYQNAVVHTDKLRVNQTYPGPLSDGSYSKHQAEWPIPLTKGNCSAGYGILEDVRKYYWGLAPTYNYTFPYPWDSKSDYNTDVFVYRNATDPKSALNGTSTEAASGSKTHKGSAMALSVPSSLALRVIFVSFLVYLF
ncbi:Acid phosphatase [Penicillium chermesinum]|uniref:acid phosphatase n=1 Tax=Penicillium chermesinum TaxID=63820 RepID=A0A9W9TX02_9EURO|nr:Acid phosphatase [Penicillium chermesinum]KAJ5246113.1 Acid phosphatase [Penicillium chermesinum]KAJ6144401.1 Acid phosphatase [Penicillium chermesinum]